VALVDHLCVDDVLTAVLGAPDAFEQLGAA
jgi:hypothetical protein